MIHISCHCGLNTAELTPTPPADSTITICHCSTCRHSTGQQCTSYLPIRSPEDSLDADNLVAYLPKKAESSSSLDRDFSIDIASQEWMLWFCKRCGSHIYRLRKRLANSSEGLSVRDGSRWEVATGLIRTKELRDLGLRFQGHENVLETRDGGLCKWIVGPQSFTTNALFPSDQKISEKWIDEIVKSVETLPGVASSKTEAESPKLAASSDEDVVQASCHCGNVSFHITRPNSQSTIPTSDFSDLIKHRTPAGLGYGENPHDEKWWIRPSAEKSDDDERSSRYFTGTCVCESCRLSAGACEVQAWAFVPKGNIFFHLPISKSSDASTNRSYDINLNITPSSKSQSQTQIIPLDFSSPEISGILSRYKSRSDVTREFCPRCGATVFWRGEMRSELIDVSVGLLRAEEGVGARKWLDWCDNRVSFMEEVLGDGEEKGVEKYGREDLVEKLLGGLRAWNRENGKV